MNTRSIAAEYRLSHWAGIMREREESELSVREFCANTGFHENVYFYWQRKLREAACNELGNSQGTQTIIAPSGFTEVKIQSAFPAEADILQSHICIEVVGARITADSGYPAEKLAALLRGVARGC